MGVLRWGKRTGPYMEGGDDWTRTVYGEKKDVSHSWGRRLKERRDS